MRLRSRSRTSKYPTPPLAHNTRGYYTTFTAEVYNTHGYIYFNSTLAGIILRGYLMAPIGYAGIYTGSTRSVEVVELLVNVKFLDGILGVTDLVDLNDFNGLRVFGGWHGARNDVWHDGEVTTVMQVLTHSPTNCQTHVLRLADDPPSRCN